MKRSIFLMAAALVAFACTPEEKATVEEPFLKVDNTEFSVSNEAQEVSLTVTSNRDWSIQKSNSADWLGIEDLNFTAPKSGEASKDVKVSVAANSSSQSRTANFYIYSSDAKIDILTITVTQSAQAPFLRVTSSKTVDGIKAEGQEVEITIESNAAWKAQTKEGSTASVSYRPESGSGNGTLVAVVAANAQTVAQTATVVVSAEGCENIEIVLNQEASIVPAEAEITYPESTGYTAHINAQLISSLGGKRAVFVNSPVEWEAKVAASSTSTGIVLSKASGHSGLDTLVVTVGANKDWDNRKAIAIEITPKGGKTATASLEQEKGSILALEMYLPVFKGYWPFEETPATETGTNSGTGSYTVAGYKFGYKATSDCMFETSYGWRVGRGIGDYYEFPAISGKKLKKVSIVDGNAGGVPAIVDAAGATVNGGANNQCDLLVAASSDDFKTIAVNKLATWTLSGTKGNTAYRLQATADGTLRMRYISAEYVDENAPEEGGGDTPSVALTAVPATSTIVDGAVFSSLGKGARQIKITTTAKWSAKIASTTTAEGVVLSTSSGEGSGTIDVTVGQNKDWSNRKKIDIEISAEGATPVTVNFEQEKGSIIAFEFRDFSNNKGIWPFVEAPNLEAGKPGPGAYSCCGYTIKYYTVADCFSEEKFGWRIGTGVGNYIDTPAIEGKKLVKMEIYEKNGSPAKVTDLDGNEVLVNDAPEKGLQEWALTGTAENTSYRYINTTSKTLRFYVIRLFYE